MTKQYVPAIDEADYAPLRELMRRELPETHAEWLERLSAWMALGYEVEHVDVTPSEFLEFCWDRGWTPNLESLTRFASEKALSMQAA